MPRNVRCARMRGPATCASCAIRCSARRCSRGAKNSRPPISGSRRRRPRRSPRTRPTNRTAPPSKPRSNAPAACSRRPRPNSACRGRRCIAASTAWASSVTEATREAAATPRTVRPVGWARRLPLAATVTVLAFAYMFAAASLALLFLAWLDDAWQAIALATLVLLPVLAYHVRRAFAPSHALFRALAGTVASYRDGDYGFGLHWQGSRDLEDLVAAHNDLGDALRDQRLALVQRELLLDTMVQHTPVAMLLIDPHHRVVHGNLAARKLLGDGKRLEGQSFDAILERAPDALRDALQRGGDGMFTVGEDDNEDIYHLARRTFRLNGRKHELVLLRQLTAELRRQEVQTWKKVIRVISHELNNSLAPIASLAHSGNELLRRGQYERLPTALTTIEERARHLEGFIRDYARFAKLPAPRSEPVRWSQFLEKLRTQVDFSIEGAVGDALARFDV